MLVRSWPNSSSILRISRPAETSQLQFYDSIGLRVVEAETLHNGRLCLCKAALAGADGGDDLIHNIHSLVQTFQDVLCGPGLFSAHTPCGGG